MENSATTNHTTMIFYRNVFRVGNTHALETEHHRIQCSSFHALFVSFLCTYSRILTENAQKVSDYSSVPLPTHTKLNFRIFSHTQSWHAYLKLF